MSELASAPLEQEHFTFQSLADIQEVSNEQEDFLRI